MPDWYRWADGELILVLCVQPRARQDAICGPNGDCLKIQITAAPTDGKANTYLCRYLARICGVRQSAVRLLGGQTSRRKRVGIQLHKHSLPEVLSPFDQDLSTKRNR